MVTASFVRHSKPVDLSYWGFDASEQQIFEAAIQTSINDDSVDVCFPFQWGDKDGIGGPPVDHPDEIHISLSVLGGDDMGPTFTVRLKDLVKDFVATCTHSGYFGEPVLRENLDDLRRFRDALAESVAVLDTASSK